MSKLQIGDMYRYIHAHTRVCLYMCMYMLMCIEGGGGGAVYKNKSRKRIYTKTFAQVKALQSF
jgi:hypothetical protein